MLSLVLVVEGSRGRKQKRKQGSKSTYLDELVPAGGDNDRVLGVGAESNARNPFGVALLVDGELAVTEGVPQLNGAVARARDDLTVVGREGDGKDVVGVADESSGSGAGSKLPQAESLVPRSRQSVSTIRGDNLFIPYRISQSCSHWNFIYPFFAAPKRCKNREKQKK